MQDPRRGALTSMSAESQTTGEVKEPGFSGADWSEYVLYRPIYKESFFRRIYEYHAQKPGASWSTAHDVGAGHGIVSSNLATKFERVVVSDPNDGYSEIARQHLIGNSGKLESKFLFLQEGAEQSSVETGTVDMITACTCMHWMNTVEAVDEFARQLKPGGTLAITYYSQPLILGNERAQSIWEEIFKALSKKNLGLLIERALQISGSGYDSIAIPVAQWERVKRVYINASRGISSFQKGGYTGEDMVESDEERVWVYNDPDWSDEQRVDWFKRYLATWGLPFPESEFQGLWDELEHVANGAKLQMETPVVMVFATRRT
ncbi:S-adenosyl-L-methionine-dependent methyltransferase [Xylaria sp. FL1777]|nr:S-adenosyl-L-methionine-dependent methyltransferase [Xylaria sp. FL1777]